MNIFCDDLYLKIINGDISLKNIKIKKNEEEIISNFFEKKYDFTPFTLALRHSYHTSNIEFILNLFNKKIFFNIFYRNSIGNSIFDLLVYFIINLKKMNIDNKININNFFNKDLQYLFDIYKNKIEEFSYKNKNGNTFFMNILLSKDIDYIKFILNNINNIHNNFYFNDIKTDFLDILNINHFDNSILDIISKIKFKIINNNEKDKIWKIIAKNIKNIYIENKTKNNKIKNLEFFNRINMNNETPILNLCKNTNIKYFISQKYCTPNEINFNNNFLKNIDYIDNFMNNSYIYTIKNKLPIDVILYIKKGTTNFSIINHKNESIFYLLCKYKFLRLARDLLEYNNYFELCDIYPLNKPNVLYYILKNNLKGLKNNEKDRIFNYFQNNTIDFLMNHRNNRQYIEDLDSSNDRYVILSTQSVRKDDIYYILNKFSKSKKNKKKYNFIMKRILIIKFKNIYLIKKILTNELFDKMLFYLFDN